jgi:hypothetical protein
VRERDDRWVELAARVYGLSERDLRDIVTHDHDSGSLAILIHLTRKALSLRIPFGRFWGHLPNSTYAILFLNCSMTSVRSGTKLSKKREARALQHSCPYSPDRFAIFTSLCIKVPMLPQLRFPLPPILTTSCCSIHRRIHCATSPVIAQTRSLMFLLPFSPNLFVHPMPRLITLPLGVHCFTASQRSKHHPRTPFPLSSDDTWRNRRQLSAPRSHFTRLTSSSPATSHRCVTTRCFSRCAARHSPGRYVDSSSGRNYAAGYSRTTRRTRHYEILSTTSAPAPIPTSAPVPVSTPPVLKQVLRRSCRLHLQSLAPVLRPSSTSPSLTLLHRPVSHPCPMQTPFPSSAARHPLINRQRHIPAPTCSWTREYRECALRMQCCNCSCIPLRSGTYSENWAI